MRGRVMDTLINSMLTLSPNAVLSYHKKTRKILFANTEATRILTLGGWYDEEDKAKLHPDFIESIAPCYQSSFSVHLHKDIEMHLVFDGKKLPIANAYVIYIYDTTKEEQKNKNIIAERDRYKTLIQHAPSAVCLFEWDGKTILPIIIGNELVKILGIDEEKIMSRDMSSFFKVLHPDEMFMFTSQLRRALFETKSLKGIYRLYNQTSNGYQYVYIEAICLPQNDGRMFIMSSFTNVHAEREKSKALMQVNEELKLLYEHLPGAIFKLNYDKNLTLSYANDKFYAYLGYNAGSFYKLRMNSFVSIVFEDDLDHLQEAIRSRIVNHSSSPITLEVRLKTATNELRWVSLSGTVMEDEQSNPYCYFIYLDIDAYKQKNIIQANEVTAWVTLVNSIPVGIIHFNQNNKLLFANKKALEILDYRSLQSGTLESILSKTDLNRLSTIKHNEKLTLNLVKRDGQKIKTRLYTSQSMDEENTSYLFFETV